MTQETPPSKLIDCEVAMKPVLVALTFVGLAFSTLVSGQGGDPHYGKPKRLNKMIELLEAGHSAFPSRLPFPSTYSKRSRPLGFHSLFDSGRNR